MGKTDIKNVYRVQYLKPDGTHGLLDATGRNQTDAKNQARRKLLDKYGGQGYYMSLIDCTLRSRIM